MGALKPLIPSLREKKRYLAYEIIAKKQLSVTDVSKAIKESFHSYAGDHGAAQAGLVFLNEKHNTKTQRGLVRVNHKWVEPLRASFTLIKNIKNEQVIARSVGVSGILNKAEQKYIAG